MSASATLPAPEIRPGRFDRWDVLFPLILLTLGAVIFFGTMGCRDLWEPEELRYAEVTREMMQNHQWYFLHLNGLPYAAKPPLFFWTIALSARLTGHFDEFAVRLSTVLSGLGVLLFTFLLGRRLYGRTGGFLAGLFALAMPFFTQMSIEARMDMMLTFFITVALYCLYVAYTCGHGTWLYLVAFFFMGLATVTKGLLGLALPLLTFSIFALLKDNLEGAFSWRVRHRTLVTWAQTVLRLKLSPVPLRLGWGLLIVALIVCPWLVMACIQGGWVHSYDLIVRQNLVRYFCSWTHEKESMFLYFAFVPLQVLPWVALVPAGIAFSLMREPQETRWARRFSFIWFATVFLFFTFCSSKRYIYTLPLIPAAALMFGGLMQDFFVPQTGTRLSRLTRGAYVLTLVLIILTFVIGLGVGLAVSELRKELFWVALPTCLIAILAAAAALRLFVKDQRAWASFAVIMAAVLVGWTTVCWTYFAYRNNDSSAKIMLATVKQHMKPGDTLYTACTKQNGYNYYWDGPEGTLVNLSAREAIYLEGNEEQPRVNARLVALLQEPRPVLCLMTLTAYKYLVEHLGYQPYVLEPKLMGSRDLVLVTNQPPPAGKP